MLFNSYSYEILYEQFHWIYLQGDIKLLLATVNNRFKFEIEIVSPYTYVRSVCDPVMGWGGGKSMLQGTRFLSVVQGRKTHK